MAVTVAETLKGIGDHMVDQLVPHPTWGLYRPDGSLVEVHFRGGRHLHIRRAGGGDEWLGEDDIIHVHDSDGHLVERREHGQLGPGDVITWQGPESL